MADLLFILAELQLNNIRVRNYASAYSIAKFSINFIQLKRLGRASLSLLYI